MFIGYQNVWVQKLDLDDKSYKNDVDCGCWATNVSEKLQRVDLVEKRSVSTVL